ncbi:MAG: insulinase family protein [Proteobacteria bacterium]|jgi:zinc protease|nr:insulinase family protein [Pseudomonadota bacterium]
MLKRALLYTGVLCLFVSQLVLAQVHEFTLANGMKVLVKEDHRAPVVVTQVWYKVGSSYEHNGITGISHVLEHMMFKGTDKHGPGEFSRIIAENGGSENAFTGADYTAYFQQLEKSRLPISFELEADRMRNLTLPEEEFKKEVAVVMEERRLRTEDKPRSLTLEQFYANAFVTSPYHHPIIGWMNDLENLTVSNLRSWYQRWYAPNNATLVVVGDVNAQEVLSLARQYFEPLKVDQITPVKPRLETEQRGPRRIVVKAPAKLPYLLMGYKVPVLNTASEEWEPYALEVLAGILSGSGSARLPRDLVRKQQIAASADVSYDLYSRLGDIFVFDATPAEGHSIDEVEQAWRDQVKRLNTGLVEEDELARIKAQVVASKIYEQDSIFYQAMQMGILETVGLGWQKLDEYPARIRAVTAAQVQAVAKKYLVDDQLTVAVLEPLPLKPDQPVQTPPKQ